MKINLSHGELLPSNALELLVQIIEIKIQYHSDSIVFDSAEEDIQCRESKIIKLQQELYDLKNHLGNAKRNAKCERTISITFTA